LKINISLLVYRHIAVCSRCTGIKNEKNARRG
jgi:hypothetical protein